MFKSLRTRLTLIFVGLTIVPLVFVGVSIGLRGFNTLQERAIGQQNELAHQTSLSLESFFNERRAELLALTQIYGLDTLDYDQQRDILLTLLSEQDSYYQLTLTDGDGNEQIRITRGEVITDNDLVNRGDEPLFQSVVASGEIGYGEVYFNESARDRQLTIAVPIEDLYTGQISNVLIAEVGFQKIGDGVLRNLNLEEAEDVYIVNSEGVILAHRNPNLVIKETKIDLPDEAGRAVGLTYPDAIIGLDTIRFSRPDTLDTTDSGQTNAQDLIVITETSYENATALANDLSGIAAFITIVTLVLASAIVAITVNRVVQPIIDVAKVAQTVQQGDLSARADEDAPGEIAVLGRAFNSMTAELQHTLDGLQENVEQLEASNIERERLINDLVIAKKIADENSRLKSEFLATMSHELRTPLNAIEGFTSIMLGGMGIELSARAEDMVSRISSNSKRLLQLINDFLDLSRIESGRLELVHSPLSPHKLVTGWKNEVGVLAEEKGVRFVVNVSDELPEQLLGDEDALSKIAINLLGNAFKFTSEGQVTLELGVDGNNWTIAVSDTGIGIPTHAHEYIFDEFRQVDGSSKRLYGGTGLGLSLVQKLSRAMGGNVSIASEVGAGSTFTVTLPLDIVEKSEEGVA